MHYWTTGFAEDGQLTEKGCLSTAFVISAKYTVSEPFRRASHGVTLRAINVTPVFVFDPDGPVTARNGDRAQLRCRVKVRWLLQRTETSGKMAIVPTLNISDVPPATFFLSPTKGWGARGHGPEFVGHRQLIQTPSGRVYRHTQISSRVERGVLIFIACFFGFGVGGAQLQCVKHCVSPSSVLMF